MKRKRNLSKMFENNHLTLDQWMEILARLPLRVLVKFRLVCKDWNSLIKSHAFHMLHLRHFNNNRESKFLLSLEDNAGCPKPFVVRHSKSFRKIEASKLLRRDEDLILGDFLGYVDGIVVMLSRSQHDSLYNYSFPINQIFLWNPSFPRSIMIPKPFKNLENINVGFGFDNLLNVYKVVVFYMECPNIIRYVIYHLCRENSWSSEKKTKCPSPHNELYMKKLSCMTNYEGGVYWICYDNVDMNYGFSRILRFDLASERYSCISMPQDEYKIGCKLGDSRHLSVMNTSLAILDRHYFLEHISVWVLDRDVKIDSWTKLYNVDIRDLQLVNCLVLNNNAELFFREYSSGVRSCNLKSDEKQIKILTMKHRSHIQFMRTYEESLVLLEEFIRVGKERENETTCKIRSMKS